MSKPRALSSFYKYGGKDCCIIIYKEPYFQGTGWQICEPVEDLGRTGHPDYNDAVQSFKIGARVKSGRDKEWSKSNGWCLTCDGKDQNSGTISERWMSQAACLKKCNAHSGAKGCEHADWKNTCIIHTAQVSKGNGNSGTRCWVAPNNCK